MAHRQSTTLRLAPFLLFALVMSVLAQQSVSAPSLPVAQPPQAAPGSSGVTLRVQTQLTIEDVTVTDTKGQPVHGLTQSDFTVKEDGKPQTIKNFQENSVENQQPQAAPPQLPPGTYTNRQATGTSVVNILLFDSVGARPEGVARLRLQALKYLNTIPPGSQVAIMTLTTRPHIVQGFTSDQSALRAGINSIRPDLVPGTYLPPPVPDAPYAVSIDDLCRILNNQSDMAIAGLDAIAAFVSGMKGRKNLIWFTGGMPWLTDYPHSSVRVPCLHDYTSQLHRAYGLLTAAHVAVYPVGGSPNASSWDIADSTGGVPYFSELDVALKEAITTGSSYYTLSYIPPRAKYDGQYHTIEVKVDRPGLELHYRVRYISMDLARPVEVDEKNPNKPPVPPISEFHAAMMYGKPDATELLFNVSMVPSTSSAKPGDPSSSSVIGSLSPKLKGKPLVRYDFTYELPAGEITLTGDDPAGNRKGSVELIVAASSADGELLNSTQQAASFPVKADQVAQFMQEPFRFHVQLDLPPGKIFIRVGVLDVPTQKMGILEIPEIVAVK